MPLLLCPQPLDCCSSDAFVTTVRGKSLAHFFLNFSVAPQGEGGQFWNWSILSNGVLQLPDFFRGDIFNGFQVILV